MTCVLSPGRDYKYLTLEMPKSQRDLRNAKRDRVCRVTIFSAVAEEVSVLDVTALYSNNVR